MPTFPLSKPKTVSIVFSKDLKDQVLGILGQKGRAEKPIYYDNSKLVLKLPDSVESRRIIEIIKYL